MKKHFVMAIATICLILTASPHVWAKEKKSAEEIKVEMAGLTEKYIAALTQANKEKAELEESFKAKKILDLDVNSVSKSKLNDLITRLKKLRSSQDEALQYLNDLMNLAQNLDVTEEQLKSLKVKQHQAISSIEQANIKITSMVADAQKRL